MNVGDDLVNRTLQAVTVRVSMPDHCIVKAIESVS